MTKLKQRHNLPVLIIATIFIGWSAIFIYRVSFIAIDGKRYFNLFDDAMISMRYAWNLSHGLGLVWNPGEYIEGYTNLLMTLFMASIMFIVDNKRAAAFIIHLSGIFFMLGSAYMMLKIAVEISRDESQWHQKWLKILTFVTVLFYYPLAYWALMGMEMGLLSLLTLFGILSAFKYVRNPQPIHLFSTATALGLAYLTRPDALIAAVLIFIYLSYEIYQIKPNRAQLIALGAALGILALFVLGQQLFRWSYYGELVPNTYTLKATGMPLLIKIRNGVGYMIPFVASIIIPLILMGLGLLLNRQKQKLLLVYIAVAYIYYQIWVGGDAFPPYWRIIAPAAVLILVLAIQGILHLIESVPKSAFFSNISAGRATTSRYPIAAITACLATLIMLLIVNAEFLDELSLMSRPYEATSNEFHINTAIALNNLTTEKATIGVTSAGTVPYYSDRIAIDFLGKSDKYIANLPPDLSGATNYQGMLSLPGHNKYDLHYSIKTLQPTYVQTASWGQHVLVDWVEEHYATVQYQGIKLYLLRDSVDVLWAKVEQFK